MTDHNHISSKASLGQGIGCIRFWSQVGSELWFPWQQIAPIGLYINGENLVSTLALPFFIGFSLFLQVTMTAIKALMG